MAKAKSSRRVYKSAASAVVLNTDTEARAMIARLGEIDRAIAHQADIARQEVEQAKATLKAVADNLTTDAKAIHRALKSYFEAHADRLTDGGKRKTVDWPEGRMGHRLSKPKLKLLMEEALVVDFLDARCLDHLLRVDIHVDKAAMLAALADGTDNVADLAEIDQREEFFAAAAEVETERAVEVDAGEDAQ